MTDDRDPLERFAAWFTGLCLTLAADQILFALLKRMFSHA